MTARTRTCFLLFVLLGPMLSCTHREEGPAVSPQPRTQAAKDQPAEGPATDRALSPKCSVAIAPCNPTADMVLGAQFTGLDQEGGSSTRYRWFVDNELVQDGQSCTLPPGGQKKGSVIYVEIVPSGPSGAGRPVRSDSVTIINKPPVITSIVMKPLPAFTGTTLTAVPSGKDIDGDMISYNYQWKVNGVAVAGAENKDSFSAQNLHKKDVISAVVTPCDRDSCGEPVVAKVTLSNSAPEITSAPANGYENGVYSYQVKAKDLDGDSLDFSFLKSPPGMTIDRLSGLIRWTVPAGLPEKREVVVRVSVDDGDSGIAYQEFTLTLEGQ